MDTLINILMIVVTGLAAYGSYRQSKLARVQGSKGAANLWIVAAAFCGFIAITQIVGLFIG